jgi:hypothetical protein
MSFPAPNNSGASGIAARIRLAAMNRMRRVWGPSGSFAARPGVRALSVAGDSRVVD